MGSCIKSYYRCSANKGCYVYNGEITKSNNKTYIHGSNPLEELYTSQLHCKAHCYYNCISSSGCVLSSLLIISLIPMD